MFAMKPRIGLTTTPTVHEDRFVEALERAYVAAVVAAGAVPFVLPVLDPDDAETAISCLDGLLLTGGGDLDPALYSCPRSPAVGEVDVHRDAWEIALFRAGLARRLPMLGICRGAQVMNVALGGSLVQHLPDISELEHCDRQHCTTPVHTVDVLDESRLRSIVGRDVVGVNSLHHQAVSNLGTGLAAVAWAEDGIVEAVEGVDGLPVVGVQWHPELLPHEPGHAELFRWLIREATEVCPTVTAA
jgi:putative glutamine amidotransferase